MTILVKLLGNGLTAKWDSEDGALTLLDFAPSVVIRIPMESQIKLIELLEEIIEKQPPIGPGT